MGVTPNTEINIYKGCPLKTNHEDTIYFASRSEQTTYFNSVNLIRVLENQYRVEPEGNAIKVEIPYSTLYTCNYMRFKNTSHENRWFYAFITKVEYVNETTSRIFYKNDVMQTWLPNIDYRLGDCFVEREHTALDTIGGNIQPEPVQTGEMYHEGLKGFAQEYMGEFNVIVESIDADRVMKRVQNNYVGTKMMIFDFDDEVGIKDYLDNFSSVPNDIIAVYLIPKAFYLNQSGSHTPPQGGLSFGDNVLQSNYTVTLDILNEVTFEGYIPKNKKLYTFPYNYLTIYYGGHLANFRYEYFYHNTPMIEFRCKVTNPCQIAVNPVHYKGNKPVSLQPNYPSLNEGFVVSDLPVCAWANDSFKSYFEQHLISDSIGLASSVISSFLPSFSKTSGYSIGTNKSTTLISNADGYQYGVKADSRSRGTNNNQTMSYNFNSSNILTAATSCLQNYANAAYLSDALMGSASSTIDFATSYIEPQAIKSHVNGEQARVIDEFFSKFGYACNSVKVPNINARIYWTYTKTIGCTIIDGLLPVEDEEEIESIFDSGIRFWNKSRDIGKYKDNVGELYDNYPLG